MDLIPFSLKHSDCCCDDICLFVTDQIVVQQEKYISLDLLKIKEKMNGQGHGM